MHTCIWSYNPQPFRASAFHTLVFSAFARSAAALLPIYHGGYACDIRVVPRLVLLRVLSRTLAMRRRNRFAFGGHRSPARGERHSQPGIASQGHTTAERAIGDHTARSDAVFICHRRASPAYLRKRYVLLCGAHIVVRQENYRDARFERRDVYMRRNPTYVNTSERDVLLRAVQNPLHTISCVRAEWCARCFLCDAHLERREENSKSSHARSGR